MISCQDKKITEDIYSLSEMEIRFLNQSLPDNLKSADYNAKQTFIQKITKDLERQNKEKRFIKNYVEKYGYPDWQMVRWFKSNGETVAHIPLFFDNGTVTQAVMLAVEYDNKIKFRLFERDNFEKYAKNKKPVPNAEIIKNLFAIFDFQKFGESSYLPEGYFVVTYETTNNLKSTAGYFYEDCFYVATYYGEELIRIYEDCATYYVWNLESPIPEEITGSSTSGDTPSEDPVTPTCGEGYTLDKDGNCVKKPCAGNPVQNPEIASSGYSGKEGGTFGCTRFDPNLTCGGVKGRKYHDGLDIITEINGNAFSMYGGIVYSIRDSFSPSQYAKDSYGNYVIITILIDGTSYYIKYNHLNEISVTLGQLIEVGDIVGLYGNTGNAAQVGIIPHTHIQVFNSNWEKVNPLDFLATQFDSNYNAIINTNCI